MVNPIPNSIDNLWEQWNIRGAILFSLFLQIFLIICSPLRKHMQNVLLLFSIWSAYLIADVVANFCVGLIASNLNSSRKSIINTQGDLLAFWAPFLLVHLGGPDTITAFSLEDNQLWLRHMMGLIFQFISCAYVFMLTVPGNKLWIPTLLVFVAGTIKYVERTCALYLGSKYWVAHKKGKVLDFDDIPEHGGVEKLSHISVVLLAHRMCYQWNIKRSPYHEISAQDALRVMDTEWNFHYEGCYTKFWALCRTSGCLSRSVAIICQFAAFGLFFSEDKHKQGFDAFDVKVTYALLFGAMALDTISLLMLLFSDRAVAYFYQHDVGSCFFILEAFHELIKRQKWSKCKKQPYTKFTELSTWVPFRKWKGSISGFDMINCCRSKNKFFVPINSFWYSHLIFTWLNKTETPFLLELWEFIFSELKRKSQDAKDGKTTVMKLRSSMGEWTLEKSLKGEKERRENLRRYVTMDKENSDQVGRLIVWHIATHMRYVLDSDDQVDGRQFSKLLSDYIIYIAFCLPDTTDAALLQEKLKELMKFFISDKDEVEACKKLLIASRPGDTWLSDACNLAKELGMISEVSVKWEFISQVWVELLSSFAAKTAEPIHHLQYLSQGGELISRVWLLMNRLEIYDDWAGVECQWLMI